MNSWQQPVAGEPSMGTKHEMVPANVPGVSTATGVTTLSLSGLVPAGSRGATIKIAISSVTAAGRSCTIEKTGTGNVYGVARTQVIGVTADGIADVPLDSNLGFDQNNSAVITVVTLTVVAYFI